MSIFNRSKKERSTNQTTEEVKQVSNTEARLDEKEKRDRKRRIVIACSLVLALVLMFFVGSTIKNIPSSSVAAPDGSAARMTDSTPSPSPTPTPTASTEACEPEYTQVPNSNVEGRVVDDFKNILAQAVIESGNLSDSMRSTLLEEAGKDVSALTTLAFALHLIPEDEVNERDHLVEDGCLSQEGIILHSQIVGALSAEGTTFEEAQAPADWYNSGINDGVYGVSETQGIYGDRTAIKITMRDGSVVYILVRCANPVFPPSEKPNLPPVTTDNPPPPPPTGDNPPPVTPPTPTPKVAEEGSYHRGNAETAGGPNVHPGPGATTRPTQPPVERGPEPTQPAPEPPAPQPVTPTQPSPAPAPTLDPAPPAPIEPVAPQPSDPVIEPCIIPPGETTC